MQLHLLSILLLGISANMDNLVVGLSYGIKKVRITGSINVFVGLISFVGTIISMLFGKSILPVVPQGFSNIIGGLIIIFIGSYGLIRSLLARTQKEDDTTAGAPSMYEAFFLGFALAINNIGLGIGASMAGLEMLPTAICSFLFSLLFFYAGNRIGLSKFPSWLNKLAEPLADVLMILLGLFEILMQ